ncbi:magnesium transporter MgtE N-terminal domain-containing protein [Kribbella sp. NBC_00889]|uniref:magnesium transporter MgtE N-terminal domain-containing protein n=1 Tax=Kribbella sp. NBC_00889 TaxID=2975974 RepID=UPI0038685FBC|nr:hypothetical protein OG817_10955 [Kribbella sp. NBC_00889]
MAAADDGSTPEPSQQTGPTFATDGSIAGLNAGRDINIGSTSSINDLVLELQHLSLNGAFQRFRRIELKAGVLGRLSAKNPRRASDLVEKLLKVDAPAAGQLIRQLDATFAAKLLLPMKPVARAELMAAFGAPARIVAAAGVSDGAGLLTDLARVDVEGAATVLQALPETHRAEFVARMDPHQAARILCRLEPTKAAEILDRLRASDPNTAESVATEVDRLTRSTQRERALRRTVRGWQIAAGGLLVALVLAVALRGGGSGQPNAAAADQPTASPTPRPLTSMATAPNPPIVAAVPRDFPADHLLRDDLGQWSDICGRWMEEPEAKDNQVTRLIYSCETEQGVWVVYTQYSLKVTPFTFGKPKQADAVAGSWTGPDKRSGTYLLYSRDPGRPGFWLEEAGTSRVAFMVWAPEKSGQDEQQLEDSLRALLRDHGYTLTS